MRHQPGTGDHGEWNALGQRETPVQRDHHPGYLGPSTGGAEGRGQTDRSNIRVLFGVTLNSILFII